MESHGLSLLNVVSQRRRPTHRQDANFTLLRPCEATGVFLFTGAGNQMQNMEMNAGTPWEQFYGELYGFLRTRVNSDATAQDTLQSAFLRAHKQLTAGDAPEQPRAWLYQIVRNLIVDVHRPTRCALSRRT